MSVFTKVSLDEASQWVKQCYSVGKVVNLRGIQSGIENTNFYLDTDHGIYVLTLFEKLTATELPFYLNLMAHLSSHGVPVPTPIKKLDNQFLGQLNGKPAAIVSCIPGSPSTTPTRDQLFLVGEQLAHMHLAGQSFEGYLENLRGTAWWTEAADDIYKFLDEVDADLLRTEIAYQAEFVSDAIPRGPIHADLFRDNVLFDDSRVGGFIDLYFACIDAWVYDVAITANDWCIRADSTLDNDKLQALLSGYNSIRQFTSIEKKVWPIMLRAGALRFWVSRLYDLHLPRPGELTHAHDPDLFKCILRNHRANLQIFPK
ncbi:MAG: homoserine kinase [Betaproteobacteria bacterium TMED22]|nr:MAG: homoserine kinase [Betaproteobacteria bacterium TMED22]|tara:strand:- start:24425 stop:25369 length:945 start_codon:yes stop_codon:yes gene_type:complete